MQVVLHRVGVRTQGPVDSQRTGPDGGFRFRFPRDTTAVHLLSVSYSGIEYFSQPVAAVPGMPDQEILLLVADTSHTAPVRLVARYLVVRAPGTDGRRPVLDLVVLENPGHLTRTSPDSTRPTWTGPLPPGVGAVRVTDDDLSGDAVTARAGSLLVFSPVAPGQKDLAVEYALPPGDARLAFPEGRTNATVLLEDLAATVQGSRFAPADTQFIEGIRFLRWVGSPEDGETIAIRFGAAGGGAQSQVLLALVVLAASALALLGWRFLRRPPPSPNLPTLDQLTDALAALDARYAGREAEVGPDEWRRYQEDRARLRARAAAHLAGARPPA